MLGLSEFIFLTEDRKIWGSKNNIEKVESTQNPGSQSEISKTFT